MTRTRSPGICDARAISKAADSSLRGWASPRASRRGDAYLRCLLVQGARSVLYTAMRHRDRLSRWVCTLRARRGDHKTLVAIAAKNARIAWALLAKNQTLQTV